VGADLVEISQATADRLITGFQVMWGEEE